VTNEQGTNGERDPDVFSGIDPEKLAVTLEVLGALNQLDEDHPDFVTVRRATAQMFKSVKKARRLVLRAQVADADREVVAATATGAPDRIDDETRGRQMAMTELATGQLIDLLQDRARGGIVTMKTDNFATGVDRAIA